MDNMWNIIILYTSENNEFLFKGICQIWKGAPIRPSHITSPLTLRSSLLVDNMTILNCSLSPSANDALTTDPTTTLGNTVQLSLEVKGELPVRFVNRFCSLNQQGIVKVMLNSASIYIHLIDMKWNHEQFVGSIPLRHLLWRKNWIRYIDIFIVQ